MEFFIQEVEKSTSIKVTEFDINKLWMATPGPSHATFKSLDEYLYTVSKYPMKPKLFYPDL